MRKTEVIMISDFIQMLANTDSGKKSRSGTKAVMEGICKVIKFIIIKINKRVVMNVTKSHVVSLCFCFVFLGR